MNHLVFLSHPLLFSRIKYHNLKACLCNEEDPMVSGFLFLQTGEFYIHTLLIEN